MLFNRLQTICTANVLPPYFYSQPNHKTCGAAFPAYIVYTRHPPKSRHSPHLVHSEIHADQSFQQWSARRTMLLPPSKPGNLRGGSLRLCIPSKSRRSPHCSHAIALVSQRLLQHSPQAQRLSPHVPSAPLSSHAVLIQLTQKRRLLPPRIQKSPPHPSHGGASSALFTAHPPSFDAPASCSARTARRSRACWLRSAYSGGTFLCSSAPWLPPASDTALRRPRPSRPRR